MNSPTIRLATPEDRSAVVDTAVAAFRGDPAFSYFFPDPASFDREAAVFLAYLFDRRVQHGLVWVTDGCEAVAMWDNPESVAAEHTAAESPEFLAAVEQLGDAAERIERYDTPVEALLPTSPFWYLGILACHPDHVGRRLARAVAQRAIDEAHAAGLDAYLETTNPDNVGIYERSGWSVTHELEPVPGLTVWIMRHPAPA